VDAVVIGNQDAHRAFHFSIFFTPPI